MMHPVINTYPIHTTMLIVLRRSAITATTKPQNTMGSSNLAKLLVGGEIFKLASLVTICASKQFFTAGTVLRCHHLTVPNDVVGPGAFRS